MSETAKTQLRALAGDLKAGRPMRDGIVLQALETLTAQGTDAQKAAFLTLLYAQDDPAKSVPYVAEAARFLRSRMLTVTAPPDAVDIVGTGGDGQSTYNISTAAAFVVAGAGVPVAKHGNRAVSSRSGASDVLAALGVKLDVPPATIEQAIQHAGVGFLWAPQHHPSMKEWAKVRGELGFRTIFNRLGPLSNPANVKRQLIGVYAREWVRPVAEVMANLGSKHVWVVHGEDGLDELTTTSRSFVAELKDGIIIEFEVTPEAAGLPRAKVADLTGSDAAANAAALRDVLTPSGPGSAALLPYRDIVLLNAAAALVVAGKAETLIDGVARARQSISAGAALTALDRLIALTNA